MKHVSDQYPTRWKLRRINKARTSFSPVVTSAALAEDEVIRSEESTKGSRADRVHGTRLEIDQDGSGNILIRPHFVIVDINSFQLKLVSSLVNTVTFDAMFIGHGLPELGTCSKERRDNEYGRRRGMAVAIAYRFGYRTV